MKLLMVLDNTGREFIGIYNNEDYLRLTFKAWLDKYYEQDDEENHSYEECVKELTYFKIGSDVCMYTIDLPYNKMIEF